MTDDLRRAKLRELEDVTNLSKWLHDGPRNICLCDECNVLRAFITTTLKRINNELATGRLTRD